MTGTIEGQVVVSQNLPIGHVTVQQWAERRKAFNEWVNTQLKRGVDFGVIPGTDKPTLLLPGAQKIAQYFGCAPEPETIHREADPATGYLNVEMRVRLVNIATGESVGSGIGSCSSYESKYRYRWEWWNGKGHPEGPEWERTRSGKWRRRIENRDLIDQWNTVIKIAKKRALVDAASTVSGASEKFTQDLEDFQEESEPAEPKARAGEPQGNGQDAPEPPAAPQPQPAAKVEMKEKPPDVPMTWGDFTIKQRNAFWARAKETGLAKEDFHKEFRVESMTDWHCPYTALMETEEILLYGIQTVAIGVMGIHAALNVDSTSEWVCGRFYDHDGIRVNEDVVGEAKRRIDEWMKTQAGAQSESKATVAEEKLEF